MPVERRLSSPPGDLPRLFFFVNDPPWFLVPDAAARSAAALADRLVVFLDRDRMLRHAGDRDIGEVLAHPDQVLLRVPERREERLSGPAQEEDVLPCVRLLVFLEELRDAHLPLGVAGAGVEEHVPHALARLAREAALLHLFQGGRGGRAREEHNPFVAALELDWEADGARDVLADFFDWIRVRLGTQPDGIDDAVDDLVAVRFRDLHRADEDVPRVRVDRLVALDAAESSIFVSLISKRRHEGPLENRVAACVDILERARLLLHLLVIPPSLDQRLQHTTDDPDTSLAEMVSQLGNGEAVGRAARTVERLRPDVVLHHDARLKGRKIKFVEAFVHAHFWFEREAAAVPA